MQESESVPRIIFNERIRINLNLFIHKANCKGKVCIQIQFEGEHFLLKNTFVN